jgi:ribose-phosphate pyrophosphokinase
MDMNEPKLFALSATRDFGQAIGEACNVPLAQHEERTFEDGEYKVRPLETVAGRDVYVVQSLHAGPDLSADDKLNRLLFFVGALKDSGAAKVTVAAPYLCYARKDRRTKWQDPLTLRYMAALFEAVGTDAIVTMEIHNDAAFENAFRCRTVALTAAPLLAQYVKSLGENHLCVVSPDPGGVKRAQLFRETVEAACGFPIGRGFVEKRRSAGKVSGDLFVGEAEGAAALIVDDLIASGGTLLRAARAVRDHGTQKVIAFATHGLFMKGAAETLADPAIDRVVVCDTVPAFRLPQQHPIRQKLDVISSAGLFAQAILRLHRGERLDDLQSF